MVKAKLASVTEKWINGKTEKKQDVKTEKQKDRDEGKMMQTIYISRNASKMLWHHRAETGETISSTIEKLVLTHIGKR